MLAAASASAQLPPRLQQDALDLQARSNVVQGAGARAYGMGGAFLARPDDATAASWNPAGLSYLRSPELSVVGTHTWLKTQQRDISDTVRRNEGLAGFAPEFAAATYPVALGPVTGAVQVGFQRVLSFDGTRTIRRYDNTGDLQTLREFETLGGFDVIALASGLQVSRQLRLGLALNRWLDGYSYTFERVSGNPARQSTQFELSGWNINAGLIWSPFEALNLGAVYKSAFTADVDMNRSRVDYEPGSGVVISGNSFRSDAMSDPIRLDVPAAFGVGASWRPRSPLTLSADYTRTDWSQGRIYNYFTLPRTGTPMPPEDVFPVLPYPTLTPGGTQGDAEQFRTGFEYVVIKRDLKWPIRFGYFADRQLEKRFNEDEMREKRPTYHGFTAGTGLIMGRVLVDVAYVFEFGSYSASDLESDDPLPRDTSVNSHRFFLSLIYRPKR